MNRPVKIILIILSILFGLCVLIGGLLTLVLGTKTDLEVDDKLVYDSTNFPEPKPRLKTCDIGYDTILSSKYICHISIIETFKNKPDYKIYVQDVMCFIASLDEKEKEPYRTLTNMVLNSLLEKDPKKLYYVLIANLNGEGKDYIKSQLQNPICRTLDTSLIIKNIKTVIEKYDGKAEFAKEMNAKMLELIEIIRGKNMRDISHYKQGQHDIIKNGRLKGFETYKNDTLDGPSQQWINYPEQIMTQEFYKGTEHGFRKYYVGKRLDMVVKYEMGKAVWSAFPFADAHFPKPVKGGGVTLDSVYVECPHANDTIWYRGLYLKRKPVGIHKMFYPNGKPKFEYNYSNEKIKIFDINGKFIKEVKDDHSIIQRGDK